MKRLPLFLWSIPGGKEKIEGIRPIGVPEARPQKFPSSLLKCTFKPLRCQIKFMTEGGDYPFKIKHVFLKCPVVEEEGGKEHPKMLEVLCPP